MAKSYIDLNIEHYVGFGKLTKVTKDINLAFNRIGVDNITLTELAEIAKNNTVLTQTFKVPSRKLKSNGETVIDLAELLNGREFITFIKTLYILEPNIFIRANFKNIKIEIFRDDLVSKGEWFPLWIPYIESGGEYFYFSFASNKYIASNSYLDNLNNLPGYGTKATGEEIYIGKFDYTKGNANNLKIRFTLINK